MHLSRELLLSDIPIFVKIEKEICLIESWDARYLFFINLRSLLNSHRDLPVSIITSNWPVVKYSLFLSFFLSFFFITYF